MGGATHTQCEEIMAENYIVTLEGRFEEERVTSHNGVKISRSENRFEIACRPLSEINEQEVIKMFRSWIQKRRQEIDRKEDLFYEKNQPQFLKQIYPHD